MKHLPSQHSSEIMKCNTLFCSLTENRRAFFRAKRIVRRCIYNEDAKYSRGA